MKVILRPQRHYILQQRHRIHPQPSFNRHIYRPPVRLMRHRTVRPQQMTLQKLHPPIRRLTPKQTRRLRIRPDNNIPCHTHLLYRPITVIMLWRRMRHGHRLKMAHPDLRTKQRRQISRHSPSHTPVSLTRRPSQPLHIKRVQIQLQRLTLNNIPARRRHRYLQHASRRQPLAGQARHLIRMPNILTTKRQSTLTNTYPPAVDIPRYCHKYLRLIRLWIRHRPTQHTAYALLRTITHFLLFFTSPPCYQRGLYVAADHTANHSLSPYPMPPRKFSTTSQHQPPTA